METDREYSRSIDGAIVHVPTKDMLLKEIACKIDDLISTIDRLQEDNNNLRSEHYKDDVIKELKAENETLRSALYRSFDISEEEWKRINEWQQTQSSSRMKIGTACYRYEFTPCAFGVTANVVNTLTGEKFAFRDNSNW